MNELFLFLFCFNLLSTYIWEDPWRRGWQPTLVSILGWRIRMDGGVWWCRVEHD